MVEKRGEKESNVVNKFILKKAVEHKIKMISEKAFVSEREVYDLVRGFFKKYINIDYEFTADELMKELKKIYIPLELQERVAIILTKVSEMEHLSRPFTKEELILLLQDFQSLVNDLITTHYEKKSFFHKLGDGVNGSVSGKHKELLDDTAPLSENEHSIVKMNILLDNARRWADKDLESAKKAYQDLLVIYNTLEDDKKKSYYQPINELFAILRNKGG
jgi:hypothetical protein